MGFYIPGLGRGERRGAFAEEMRQGTVETIPLPPVYGGSDDKAARITLHYPAQRFGLAYHRPSRARIRGELLPVAGLAQAAFVDQYIVAADVVDGPEVVCRQQDTGIGRRCSQPLCRRRPVAAVAIEQWRIAHHHAQA